ncbi:F-box/kelch-repeat protein SKIP6-like [Tasmannia lanceolata]|uniref:F-box/kelch-repeat protein SKIP6-like n=1 Tax=Tasmannia lanceolata TaxID=3420 RepID=UPI00406486CD
MPLQCSLDDGIITQSTLIPCANVAGKLLVYTDRGGLFFDPKRSSWWIEEGFPDNLNFRSTAGVDGILYGCDSLGRIMGYDEEENNWKKLKGIDLKSMHRCHRGDIMLVNVEGRLWVLMGELGHDEVTFVLWEVLVRKVRNGRLQGFVLWSKCILTIPNAYGINNCLALGL